MISKKTFLCFQLLSVLLGFAQGPILTKDAQISVLTCGAGDQLYSTFGHTAFRVQDATQGIDDVYNYGTFDFNQPGFYVKFARGKLLYSLSRSSFANFLYEYEFEKRWVKEQLLDLSLNEKKELYEFLLINYQPKNRDYKYDFLFNNCSTKTPEILKKVLDGNLNFKEDHLEKNYTFRELIHQNLKTNTWSSFGIDLALGSVIDKTASAQEHMFLPLYVMHQLNNTVLNDKSLVQRNRIVLNFANRITQVYILASPLFWFMALLFFTVIISYIDFKNNVRSHWLDFFLFFVSGLAGLVIFFLWFLTDHSATANNFNILWAFPFNVVVAFYLLRRKDAPSWMPKYIISLLSLLILTLLLWILKIQVFSPLIIPILITLGIRYFLIYKRTKATRKPIIV